MALTIRKVLLAIALMNIGIFGACFLALAADLHWGYDGDQGPSLLGRAVAGLRTLRGRLGPITD